MVLKGGIGSNGKTHWICHKFRHKNSILKFNRWIGHPSNHQYGTGDIVCHYEYIRLVCLALDHTIIR